MKRVNRLVHFLAFICLMSAVPLLSAAQEPVTVYDLQYAQRVDRTDPAGLRRSWDETFLVAALQGLANRRAPRLYIFYVMQNGECVDRYWFDLFRSPMPDGTPGWLEGRPVRQAASLEELLTVFKKDYRGIVLYDERVPATSCLAATIAGAENLLPLRYDPEPGSLFSRLVTDPAGPRLRVEKRLMAEDGGPMFTGEGKIPGTDLDSTGSAKADAYRWLIETYIKPGRTCGDHAGYYTDAAWFASDNAIQNHTLTNYDYFIARRAPFVDLSPWDDEAPSDDPNQPVGTDARVLAEFFGTLCGRSGGKMIHVGGFILWNAKYTNWGELGGKHDPVSTEWKQVQTLSNFNAWLDADALGCGAMANASFFAHFPLKKRYPFAKPSEADLKKRGLIGKDGCPANKAYITFYAGDYDSAAWVYQMMPRFWSDPNRGAVPITWAFNPTLADRFGPGFDYFRKTASPNDLFVAGDSGAGYVNVMGLAEPRPISGLPDALDLWAEHCRKYYKQWDLSATGFLIDGFSSRIDERAREAYSRFSPDGIVQHHYGEEGLTGGMPWIGMKYDLPNTPDTAEAAKIVLGDVQISDRPQFFAYRTILWSPTQFKTLCETLKADPEKGDRIEIVDMYSFFKLLKAAQLEKSAKKD